MKRAALGLLAAAAVACTGSPDDGAVVLWHHYSSGDELAALERAVAAIEAEGDLDVALVSVPYEALADKLTNAIPNGNGPDLFIFAHDRLGHWVQGGLVEPVEFYVDEALAGRFSRSALAALAYDGSLYGLPLAVKSVALFYRPDLVDTPPRTTDELFALADRLRQQGYDGYPLVYENTTLYGHAPWLHGHGGGVFSAAGRLRIDTSEAIAAMAFARRLDRERVVPAGIDGRMVTTLFDEGRAAMAISGPWLLGSLDAGTPWAVATLPTVSSTGLPARPYLGVEGVLMSSRARDKRRAFQVMEALSGDDSAALRARTGRQVVPNPRAYQLAGLDSDRATSVFRDQLEGSVPMPATPQMRAVWTPYQSALLAVIERDVDPAVALREAARDIASFGGDMP